MIELFAMIVVLGAIRETAKRRGVNEWPFLAAAVAGWLVLANLGARWVGVGPHLFLSWGWVGLTYVSIFVFGGGGRVLKETWQCPECRMYNPPTTLVCPCGYRPTEGSEIAGS